MPEKRVVVTIDENGKIEAKTGGLTGASCLEALESLLQLDKNIEHIKKTDEYYQKAEVKKKQTQKNKRGRS